MTKLRKSILFMALHLAIIFNLERFDFIDQNVIDIQSFLYVLVILLVLTTISFKVVNQKSVYASIIGWILVYGALKLYYSSSRPILGDIYTYLTVTELALLTITVFLAHDLSANLQNTEEVIEKVTLPKTGQRVLAFKEAEELIKTEFIRSRRHNRPLSVVVVDFETTPTDFNLKATLADIQKNMMKRYLTSSLAQMLSREARRTDLIIEQENRNGFIILCPETTVDGSLSLTQRIRSTASNFLKVDLKCGISSFPLEALTFEELLLKAEMRKAGQEKMPAKTGAPAESTPSLVVDATAGPVEVRPAD